MRSRALGELLLLRPSTFTRITPARHTPVWAAQRRSISTTPLRAAASSARQEQPATATTPEVAAESSTPSSRSAANAAIDDLFAASSSPSTTTNTTNNNDNTTAAAQTPTDRVFGANFSPLGRRQRRSPPKLAFADMNMDDLVNPTPANKATISLVEQQKVTFENYPRLEPEYGRTVHLDVSRGRDLVRGIGMLGSMMARNKVKRDFNSQRFHERGGLRRKRLNSERWRARFKTGFQSVTGRVMELRRKGW